MTGQAQAEPAVGPRSIGGGAGSGMAVGPGAPEVPATDPVPIGSPQLALAAPGPRHLADGVAELAGADALVAPSGVSAA